MASESRLALLVALASSVALAQGEALVGPLVGNADTLASEGTRLFNNKAYPKAAEQFLKATRANPGALGAYVQLARAQLLARQLPLACYAYRVYLKAMPDGPERKKAAAESDQCERKLKGQRRAGDPTRGFVDQRAAFFAALDGKQLLGAGSAADVLRGLVRDGFLGPELGDMAQKLGAAAISAAEGVHARALAGEALDAATLRSARPLYELARDVGAAPADARGRMAFLDGLAELKDAQWAKAEAHFAQALQADPTRGEYAFFRAVALVNAGDRAGALRLLEASLKDDPRTGVLRASLALGESPSAGAQELERLLFTTRFPPEK